LADLVAFARARGETPYASPAAGSIPHFLGVEFAKAAGIRLSHVPYRGAAPALQDAMAGQIPMVVNVLGDLVPHHEAGRLRVLVVSSPARVPQLPDVPTFAEAGFPRLTADEWYGLFLPARTPPGLVAALNAAAGAAVAEPGMAAALDRQAFAPLHLPPAEYAARVRAETAFWAPIVAESGFRPDE
jgi:tripartite-type tricarboxylate transporter receptor subunit TctC